MDGTETPTKTTNETLTSWVVAPKVSSEQEKSLSADLKIWQESGLRNLESKGLITLKGEGKQQYAVLNDMSFFENRGGSIVNKKGETVDRDFRNVMKGANASIRKHPDLGRERGDRSAWFLFRDIKVVSKDEYLQQAHDENRELSYGEVNLKNLFYQPDSVASAFDPAVIAESVNTFYFTFSDVSDEPLREHPIKASNPEDDFKSGVTTLGVTIPMLIYGYAGGKRDEETGVLMVPKDLSRPDGEKQPISGQWMTNNFGRQKIGDYSWHSPKPFVDNLGGQLKDRGLLTPEDFDTAVREKDEVSNRGTFYDKRKIFYIGKEFIGWKVEKLTDTDRLVYRENEDGTIEIAKRYEAEVTDKGKDFVTLYTHSDGRSMWWVPKEAFVTHDITNEQENYPTYDENGQKKTSTIEYKDALPRLLAFRKEFTNNMGNIDILNGFAIREQIAIMEVISKSESESDIDTWLFVSRFGVKGLKTISDGFYQGGFDTRLFKFANDAEAEPKLDEYIRLQERISTLSSTLEKVSNDGTYVIFHRRLIEAMKLRSQDFLIASTVDEYELSQRAYGQLILLEETLAAMNVVLSGNRETNFKFKDKIESKLNKGQGEITRVTGIYTNDSEGPVKTLKVNIRPYEVKSPTSEEKGQARVQFIYQTRGQSFNIRVVLDEYGASLDLGSQGGETEEVLKAVGIDRHEQRPWGKERAFKDPDVFAKMVKTVGSQLKLS